MSTAKRRGTRSSRKRPVDVITGPVPTVEQLVAQEAEMRGMNQPEVKDHPSNPNLNDLMASLALHRWLASKWRKALIRWEVLTIISLGYSGVITYLWLH